MNEINVLFVCMGNICRSPTAHGVFLRHVAERGYTQAISVDSAGTHGFHIGNPPDPRAVQMASRMGVDLSGLRARQVEPDDFERFEYIIAMDDHNLAELSAIAPADHPARVEKLLAFAEYRVGEDVPDPYYGGPRGFEQVFEQVNQACARLLDHLVDSHGL